MEHLKTVVMVAFALALSLSAYALQTEAQEGAAGGGDIVYEGGGLGQVTFSHDTHLTNEGIACNSCHPDVFAMATSEPGTLTMDAINDGAECGTCHGEAGSGFAATVCMSCHIR